MCGGGKGNVMAASTTFDNFDFRHLPRTPEPRLTRKASVMDEAIRLEKLAYTVSRHWPELSDKVKLLLADWVYEILDESQPPRTPIEKVVRAITTVVVVTRLVLRGEISDFHRWMMARDSLVQAVLDGIEMDNPDYRADLKAALEEFSTDEGTWLTGDGALERLNELSRQALEEV
jgi:hypothetical protein